jgi:SH3 domain-containing YSC84-like protein 1
MKSRVIPVAFVSALLLSPAAALAANNDQPSAAAQQASGEHQLVQNAEKAVDRAKSDSHFRDLMKQAKGVFIVPNMVKGALIVGGQGGQGVLLARHGSTWSDPAFYSLGSISIGAQAGGEAGPVVMLLMTNKALNDFDAANNFSLNANAGLTIVNYAARGEGGFGKGDVIVWSGTKGALASAAVSGTDISQNQQADQRFYGRSVTTKEIIDGQATNASAAGLRSALPG